MLLFLHGFLGQKEDWKEVFSYLPKTLPIQAIDLPFHGNTPPAEDIIEAVKELANGAKILIGYSAGGRIALELNYRYPGLFEKVIAISTKKSMQDPKEREARLKADQKWIELLQTTPIDTFLEKWYSQDLFATLKTHPAYIPMLARRKTQNPLLLAQFLEQFSIAKRPIIPDDPAVTFISGSPTLGGHAIHLENPKVCAKMIEGALYDNRP